MPEGAKTPPKSATEPEVTQGTAPEPKQEEERTYPLEGDQSIYEYARGLFDVTPHELRGALADYGKQTITATAVKKKLDSYLGRDEQVAETEQQA